MFTNDPNIHIVKEILNHLANADRNEIYVFKRFQESAKIRNNQSELKKTFPTKIRLLGVLTLMVTLGPWTVVLHIFSLLLIPGVVMLTVMVCCFLVFGVQKGDENVLNTTRRR